jgi:hypothetical protein
MIVQKAHTKESGISGVKKINTLVNLFGGST